MLQKNFRKTKSAGTEIKPKPCKKQNLNKKNPRKLNFSDSQTLASTGVEGFHSQHPDCSLHPAYVRLRRHPVASSSRWSALTSGFDKKNS